MPTYEYACTSCGHRFETVQSFSDAALTACPVCQGPLRKVFGNVGIVLKGSGFYKTDSRVARASTNGSGAIKESKEKESSSSSPAGGGASKDSGSTKDSGSAKDSGSTKESSSTGSSAPAASSSIGSSSS